MTEQLPMDNNEVRAEAPRKRGRPPKSREVHEPTRMPTHQPVRSGAVTAIGRDGQVLSRTRTNNSGDNFEFDPNIIPEGWEYQWNAVSVYGATNVVKNQQLSMQQNGWTPVPAARHPGLFTAPGYVGEIVVDGLRLEERPKVLCDEARLENQRLAWEQLRNRDEALMGRRANLKGNMPIGFEMRESANQYKGRKTHISMDASLDGWAPKPSHQLAEPGE